MRFFRNTRNMTLSLSNPNVAVGPGKVKAFSEEIVNSSASISGAIGSGILQEVTEGTPDLDFRVNIVGNGKAAVSAAEPVDRIVLNSGVYVPGAAPKAVEAKPVEAKPGEAEIVVKGNNPGEGEAKPLAEVLQDGLKNVTVSKDQQSVVAAAIPPVTPTAPVKIDMANIPADLKAWFGFTGLEKKIQIIRMNDIDQLSYIGGYDTDATVQKLISQRIAELRG